MKAFAWSGLVASVLVAALGACSDDDTDNNGNNNTNPPANDAGNAADAFGGPVDPASLYSYCKDKEARYIDFKPGQEQALLDAVNTLPECTTVRLAAGTFKMPNTISVGGIKGVTIQGAGKGAKGELVGGAASTVLDYSAAVANAIGVNQTGGEWFTIENLAIVGTSNDALRVDGTTNVRIRKVRTEWATENAPTNGKYGLYPVKSTNVLMEDCEAYNASDAGIYVGQTTNAVIRRNIAKGNVAGIEIENTVNADVYENTAQDNTTGLVVFDLPENPTPGTDIKLHDNNVTGNNRANFGDGTVGNVPAGTGTFVMASRRVEITGNTYGANNTVDVAVISGLTLIPTPASWTKGNFLTENIYVHGNTMTAGSGTKIDSGNVDKDKRPLGAVLTAIYAVGANFGQTRVEPFVWDGVGTNPAANDKLVNDIFLCINNNTLASDNGANAIADLNLAFSGPAIQAAQTPGDLTTAYQLTSHVAQTDANFSCTGFTPALADVVLPE